MMISQHQYLSTHNALAKSLKSVCGKEQEEEEETKKKQEKKRKKLKKKMKNTQKTFLIYLQERMKKA